MRRSVTLRQNAFRKKTSNNLKKKAVNLQQNRFQFSHPFFTPCHQMCTLVSKEYSSIEEICLFQAQCCFHFKESHPCHFAHTRHNLRSSLRAMEWFECRMHITCFHLVVTPLVCIHQEWWVFEHQVCVVQQSICVSRRQCWLCLKPFITTMDDVACSCEESFMLL